VTQLIADSGASKTDWRIVNDGSVMKSFQTEGYNPYFLSAEQIKSSLGKNVFSQADSTVDEIYFYGSGCSAEEKKAIMKNIFTDFFPKAKIEITEDLLGAARALLGNQQGFAAILGTGTNTCVYDGEKITQCIDSLGYFLGDEGSGAAIGKKLLQAHLRNYMPEELSTEFSKLIKLNREQILDRLYNQPFPNRFLASAVPFAAAGREHFFIRELIIECFTDLFTHLVSYYENYQQYEFNCVGSIGFAFKEELTLVAKEFGMKTGKFLRVPIEELVNYHSGK